MVRKLTFAFALLFTFVVISGYIPAWITTGPAGERIQWGLFQLTLIDDITHGVTAIAALVAALTSRRLSLLFLTAFGFYYALDAIFFLTYGFFNEKPWLDDILLNIPHVGIATMMLGIVYWLAPRESATAA
jgi:hypothetical protein